MRSRPSLAEVPKDAALKPRVQRPQSRVSVTTIELRSARLRPGMPLRTPDDKSASYPSTRLAKFARVWAHRVFQPQESSSCAEVREVEAVPSPRRLRTSSFPKWQSTPTTNVGGSSLRWLRAISHGVRLGAGSTV